MHLVQLEGHVRYWTQTQPTYLIVADGEPMTWHQFRDWVATQSPEVYVVKLDNISLRSDDHDIFLVVQMITSGFIIE
jgi:hypothetical protein